MAYKKAHFKTAYLQREIPMQVIVNGALEVGALCTYNASTNTIAGATAAAAGNYIVAQSDMTLGNGHVPVENRDYRYDATVAASTAAKLVALFRIDNPDDVIVGTQTYGA